MPSCNLMMDQNARLGRPADGQKLLGFTTLLQKRSDLYRILAESGGGGGLPSDRGLLCVNDGPGALFTAVCCEIAQSSRDRSARNS